jgi:hypothetical protein
MGNQFNFNKKIIIMGTIKKGLLGGVSGKVGNIVGGNWKGIDYLRILPASVANPKTTKQLNQRTKFLRVIRFLQPLNEFVRIGFKAYAIKMSAFNAAMSYNFHHAIAGSYPDYEIDYGNARLARGQLTGGMNAGCASPEPAKISITWDDNTGQGSAQSGDNVMVVVYNPISGESAMALDAATRTAATAELMVPASWSGDEVHCYLSFSLLESLISSGGKKSISDSLYCGAVVVS